MASATNKTPRRLFLVSVPRTASNLLVKILNIQHQPNALTNEKSGYFFQDAYLTNVNKGYFNSPISQRTDAEKTEIRDAYQQSVNRLEAFSEQAQRDNKIMFTKEHAFWFVNPATMLDAEPNASEPPVAINSDESRVQQDYFRLTFSDVYGPKQTFSPNNKTIFPDEYLRTWQFAFIIRHPALAWPSLYRAMQKMSKLGVMDDDGINGALVSNMTWRWTRNLFDWCSEQSEGQPVPLILDAHDVIHSQDVVLRFCEKAGLDKNVVQFEWEENNNASFGLQNPQNGISDRNMEAMVKIMTSTLMTSKGIIKDKTPGTVEIDVEVEKWKEEFGLEAAALIENAARAAMPDYEYLRERSLKV